MATKLPINFLLGGSASGPQTEGSKDKNNDNIFDYWFKKDSSSFHDGIGPNVTSNVYEKYLEDIETFDKIGIKIYRTTIQWTRLIKNMKTFEIDQQAVKFYRDFFLKIKEKGIRLILNLFHFDIPMYWHNKGGWEIKEFTDAFAKYAKICFGLFGDFVDEWATMNEPIVVSESFYIHDFWWPALNDFKKGVQVAYNQILASAKAIREFRKKFKNDPNKQISIILNLTPAIPKDDTTDNIYASKMSNLFSNSSFLDASILGVFPEGLQEELIKMDCLPEYTKNELSIIKNNKIDFLGVNYYAPRRVQKPKPENLKNNTMSKFFEPYVWSGAKINTSRGWEIFPESLREIAQTIKNRYNNIKWFLSENGMGVQNEEKFIVDKIVQDDYRIEFIKDHLEVLVDEVNKGANCFAYCIWSPIDCWSWANAYKNRYGLVRVDLKTQERTIKKSGMYFKKISKTREI